MFQYLHLVFILNGKSETRSAQTISYFFSGVAPDRINQTTVDERLFYAKRKIYFLVHTAVASAVSDVEPQKICKYFNFRQFCRTSESLCFKSNGRVIFIN